MGLSQSQHESRKNHESKEESKDNKYRDINNIVFTSNQVNQWRKKYNIDEYEDNKLYLLSLFINSHTSYSRPYLTFQELVDLINNDVHDEEEFDEKDDYEEGDFEAREEKYNEYNYLLNFLEGFLIEHFAIITEDMVEKWFVWYLQHDYIYHTEPNELMDIGAVRRFIADHGTQTLYDIRNSPHPLELFQLMDEWAFADGNEPILSSRDDILQLVEQELEDDFPHILFDTSKM